MSDSLPSTANTDDNPKSVTLLGLYFDEHFILNTHMSHACTKKPRAIFGLRRIVKFVSAKSLKRLYFSMFRSHLHIL